MYMGIQIHAVWMMLLRIRSQVGNAPSFPTLTALSLENLMKVVEGGNRFCLAGWLFYKATQQPKEGRNTKAE